MLTLAMMLVLPSAALDEKIELVCWSERTNGTATSYLFSIDGAADTFTGKAEGFFEITGTATVQEDAIVLVRETQKTTFLYTLNRLTGTFRVASGPLGSGELQHVEDGRCERFKGNAF